MSINNELIDSNLRRRKIKEANKQRELELLLEINRKMIDIQIEKLSKYKDSWRDCEMIELKAKLVHKVNGLFLINSSKRQTRNIIHAFNYLFFLYYRYKRGEK